MIGRRWVLREFRRNERELFTTSGDDAAAPDNRRHDQDQASSVLLHWIRRRNLRRPRLRSHGMGLRRRRYGAPILYAAVWIRTSILFLSPAILIVFVHEFCVCFCYVVTWIWLWFLDLDVFCFLLDESVDTRHEKCNCLMCDWYHFDYRWKYWFNERIL